VAGEDILAHYGKDVFDVVHIRNALDHSTNPMTVIEQMIAVAKPGGYIIMHGFENEAVMEHWRGYHQWNIVRIDGDLQISGKNRKQAFKVYEHFQDEVSKVRCSGHRIGKAWCSLILRKRPRSQAEPVRNAAEVHA
jgi:ubiquinone/menaquinone biosynthesis C-methylase UbiE